MVGLCQEFEGICTEQYQKAPQVPPRDTAQNKNKGSASQNTSTPPSGNFVNTVRERGEWDDGTREAACWRKELLKEQERRYTPHIIFGAVDETESFPPSNRALMITAEVAGNDVARILIDTGSSIDIIYTSCLRRLNVGCEVYPTETGVIGFSGDVLRSVGEVTLLYLWGSAGCRNGLGKIHGDGRGIALQHNFGKTFIEYVPGRGIDIPCQNQIPCQ